jgi:hypothetical protein
MKLSIHKHNAEDPERTVITIAGRCLDLVTVNTFERELHLEGITRRAGTRFIKRKPRESDEQLATRVRAQIVDAGELIPLVATHLLPPGEEWSKPAVESVTEHLRAVEWQADAGFLHRLIDRAVHELLTGELQSFTIGGAS